MFSIEKYPKIKSCFTENVTDFSKVIQGFLDSRILHLWPLKYSVSNSQSIDPRSVIKKKKKPPTGKKKIIFLFHSETNKYVQWI